MREGDFKVWINFFFLKSFDLSLSLLSKSPILHALMKYWVYTHKPKAALRLQRYLQDPVQNSSNINSSSGSNHGKVKPNHHTYSLLGDACLMVGDQELYEVTVVRRLALSLFETYKPQHQQLENDHQPHLLVVTATPPRFSGRLGMNTWEFVVAGLIRLVKETNMAVDVRPELFDQTKKMTVSSALLKSPSSSSLPLALLPPPVSFSAKNLVVDGQEPVEEEVEATSPTSVATTATTIIDPLLSASVSLENTVLSTRDIVEIVLHMANHSTIVFPRSPVPHATDYSENTNNQEYTPQFKTIRELASMLGAAGDITSFERLMTGYVFPLSSVSSSASSSALTSSTLVKWDDQIKKSLMDDNNDAATSSSTTSTASSDTSTSLVETVHETLFLAFVESWVEANAAARRLNQTSSVARRQRGRDEKDENEGSEVQGEEAVVDVERQLMIAARIKALRTSALQL